MKYLIIFSSLLFTNLAFSQRKILCEGLETIKQQPEVIIAGEKQFGSIRKSDLVSNGLKIKLNDASIKIIGFLGGFDCHSKSLLHDFSEKEYHGDTIEANDNLMKNIWVGDLLTIGCINIEKNGKKFLVKGLLFEIIE